MTLSPGAKLGPYEILEPIGSGGMGEVWKARDTRLSRTVAIKRLTGRHSARFEQEARAIAALNHPHICQIHDVGPDYLVLEYVEGKPLRGPLAAADAVRIALQITAALEEAHGKGILHRDLKPGNILLTARRDAKLLDFGLAKLLDAGEDSEATKTIEGMVLGTAAYMSPEQAQGQPLDERSDLFSLGAVLYEMFSGKRAFPGEHTLTTLGAVIHKEPDPFQAPPDIVRIVMRCLRKAPGERFQSAAELHAALAAARLEEGPAKEQPSIAVLPFANMSPEKDSEYFSDGLAEEIINALAQIPGLKVTARTSAFAFRGKEQDIQKIAEALHVKTVLEGSVRRSGNRIRVMAQLINAADGYHLWSQRYDREMADLFDLQDEISQAIASALQVKLAAGPAPVERHKPSLPAYEALLKARYYAGFSRPDLFPRIKECFEQAIALDPNFALAHSEFGTVFLLMAVTGVMPAAEALSQVRRHARRALELEPSIPEGHAMLAMVAALLDLDWKEGERLFRLATARAPVPHFVRSNYALYLIAAGRAAEAVRQADQVVQEDPLNLNGRLVRIIALASTDRDEESLRECHAALELTPDFPPVCSLAAMHHYLRGEMDQALRFAEKAYALAPMVPNAIGVLAALLHRTGKAARAPTVLGTLAPEAYGGPRALATYYWVLGDLDAQAEWFEKSIEQRDSASALMLRYFYGRPLRGTPHWGRLMRKLNLPEA